MDVQDLSRNNKVARLTRLTRDLEQSRTPGETLAVVRQAFADAYEPVTSMLLSTRGLPPGSYHVVDTELHAGARLAFESGNGHARDDPGLVRSGGVVAAIIGRSEPRLIQDVDWSHDPYFSETLGPYASVMAIPLAGGGRLPMDWAILLKRSPGRFNVSDLEEAVERVALIAALLENQALAGELARANERLERDARQVGELQRALLPSSLPRIAGMEIAASYEPASRAGGDLYDFFPLDQRPAGGPGGSTGDDQDNAQACWCVFVGDAAGHDLATAVIMAIVQAVLHAHPAETARPATLLAYANRQLCGKRLGGFVTAFLGVYEPRLRRLSYVNAGHPPPLLRRAPGGPAAWLDEAANYPLGIDSAETFDEAVVQFEPGDTLLLYTDGITEVRNRAEDLFGPDRLARALCDASDPPAELVGRLRRALLVHQDGRAADDDQTLVAAQIL